MPASRLSPRFPHHRCFPIAVPALSSALLATPTRAAGPAARSNTPAAVPLPATPCSAPECRQFDAWLGDWEVETPDGETAPDRIAWERLEDGRLKQQWDTSADGGATRSTAFVGLYRRRS